MFDQKVLEKNLRMVPEKMKEGILGRKAENPLTSAFNTVSGPHPGSMRGEMLSTEDAGEKLAEALSLPVAARRQMAYIHIPFCRTRCSYCGFFNQFLREEMLQSYIDSLVDEIKFFSKTPYAKSACLSAVYFGGGTPTDLPADAIARLLSVVREYLTLTNDAEITMEGRLSGFDNDRIEASVHGGVNRYSFGVQSFDTEIRRSTGRILSCEELQNRIGQVAEVSKVPVLVDLIYGLPGQDMAKWQNDIAVLMDSSASGASVYMLKVYRESPLSKKIESGELAPAATIEERAEMFLASRKMLSSRSYRRLNMSHWSNDLRERSLYNSERISTDIIPFGCGAGGNIGRLRLIQHRSIDAYQKMVAAKLKPVMGIVQSPAEHELYAESGQQISFGSICPDYLSQKYECNFSDITRAAFAHWENAGLVEEVDNTYRLTVAGEFWNVKISQAIFSLLDMSVPGFSLMNHSKRHFKHMPPGSKVEHV